MNNPYATLGVDRTASQDEIKAKYKRLANEYHPDKDTGNAEKFREVQAAYELLSDPDRRALFDREGTTEKQIDQQTAIVMQNIHNLINTLVDSQDVIYVDIIELARRNILMDKQRLRGNVQALNASISKSHIAKERTKTTQSENLVSALLDSAIKQKTMHVKKIESDLILIDKMLEFLSSYTYLADSQKQPVSNFTVTWG